MMSRHRFTYPNEEKLKSKSLITSIFEQGKTLKSYPIMIRYKHHEKRQVGVSVSKRNFKRAVDRIRIKRQLREAYRLNKHALNPHENEFALMIIYIGKKFETSGKIQHQVKTLLKNIK
jgi:ribonuclease P protein component